MLHEADALVKNLVVAGKTTLFIRTKKFSCQISLFTQINLSENRYNAFVGS